MLGPCSNHPTVEATKTCAGCQRPYCESCTIELGGWTYCGTCKNAAVAASQQVQEFKLPKQALQYAIVGIFCFGIILEPVAIWKGIEALNQIKRDPRLPGKGMATAAVVIGGIFLLLNIAYFALMFTGGLSAFK